MDTDQLIGLVRQEHVVCGIDLQYDLVQAPTGQTRHIDGGVDGREQLTVRHTIQVELQTHTHVGDGNGYKL